MNHQVAVSGDKAIYNGGMESIVQLLDYDRDVVNPEDSVVNRELIRYLSEENLYCRYVSLQAGTQPEDERKLVLVHNLPLWSSGLSYEGILAVQINLNTLLSEFGEGTVRQGGALGILDEEGNIVSGIGDLRLLKKGFDIGCGSYMSEGKNHYLVNREDSALNRWQYIIIQPNTPFIRKLKSNRNFTLLMLFVLLFLGALMAYGLSRRNYKPLQMIMERLQAQKEQSDGQEDEFTYIENVLDDMENSVQEVQAVMERSLPGIRSYLLQNLLANMVTDYDGFIKQLQECRISFYKEAFTVAVVHVEKFPTEQLEKQALLKMLLWEQLRELLGERIPCGMVDMPDDNLVLVLNGDSKSLKEESTNLLQQLLTRARKELQILLVIAVGDPVDQLELLPAVYRDTLSLIGSQKGQEKFGQILTARKKEIFRLYDCPVEVRNRISNYIVAGQEDSACILLDENYHHNFDDRQVDRSVAIGYFIMLIDTILNSYSVSDAEKQRLWDECNPVAALLAEDTPEEMQMIVKGFAQFVGHYVRQRREEHTDSQKRRILKFIETESSNNEMSLSYVADHFFITPNYLSNFFKEQIGETFLNYLTKIRMEHAKDLLIHTEYTVVMIADMVGYASSNTFIRTFKKTEKMTPGEYREYVRQKGGL